MIANGENLNPTPEPEETHGEGGDCALTPHKRGDRAMIDRALREGWPVTAEKKLAIVEGLFGLFEETKDDPEHYSQARGAADLLLKANAQNITAAQHLDKNNRIDSGDATELVKMYRNVDMDRI